MAEYRAYLVGDEGHIMGFEPLVCDDDGEAIEQANGLFEGAAIELWCGERLVTRISHKPE